MRRFLDRLYALAAALAAVGLIGTLAMVLTAIAGRLLNFHLPGTDAYAGYAMAASGFLALASTFRRGEHIRVTLLADRLTGARRRALEVWALAVGTLLAALFAWFACRLVWQSWQFNDISTASDATPLWIPQLAMAFGTLVLLVAIADEFVAELRGKRTRAVPAEALRNE